MSKYLIYQGDLYEKIESAVPVVEIEMPIVEHDGCVNCKYLDVEENSEPCVSCKGNYTDKWQIED